MRDMDMSTAQPETSFGSRVRSAVFWRSGTQILSQLVSWGVTVFVMRLLDPKDYGLFAMTQVVTVMLFFLNGYGFANALIGGDSVTLLRIRQTFGLLILLNGSLAIIQFFAAPLAGAYFHQDLVTVMLRWQALLYLPTPFIALPSAILARGLDFKKQAITNLASMLAGALTSFYCVYTDWGVWTLVAAPIVATIVRALGLTIAARLLVWPSFNFKGAGDIVRYGSAMVFGQFFWIIQSQADVTIAGRLVMPRSLGLYAEALFLTQIFAGKFLPPLNEVAFPSYAEMAKTGRAVGPAFITAARIVMMLTLPLYFGLAVTAEPLVATVFGPKWMDMAPLITILALAMPFWTLQLMFAPATNALGYSSLYVWVNAWGAALLTIGYLVGIQFGIYGLALRWLISTPLLLLITAWLSMPKMKASPVALIRGLTPNILAATSMAAAVHYAARFLVGYPNHIQLLLLFLVGVGSYFGLLYFFARRELNELYELITKRKLPL